MAMDRVSIADREVGPGQPPFLIAEVGQAHDGSLSLAHSYIDAIADVGVDAVKFQTHIADAESTHDEEFRVALSGQDATRFDYWKRTEFDQQEWQGLADHARDRGLVFLSSAFSEEAVDLLERLAIPAWKVGSGELRSRGLIKHMASTGKPVLLSSGMSTLDEVEDAVREVREAGAEVAVFQCTSRYPVPYEEVGLNVLDAFRERFGCPVGLSDHSGSIWPSVVAMSAEADLIEVHVVLDRRMKGPDTEASVTVDELALIREARDAVWTLRRHHVEKDRMADSLHDMRRLFGKSISPTVALAKGTVLDQSMLTLKKPAGGITEAQMEELIGRRLARDVSAQRLLRWEDVE